MIDELSLCEGLQQLADESSARMVEVQELSTEHAGGTNGFSITRPRSDHVLVAVVINGKLIVRRLILSTSSYYKFLREKLQKWFSELKLTQLDFVLQPVA